ncbi:hypothetical protein [Mucilaginibacter sp. NFX135]|uniref:hypothetical protein n=1 Tax=Mucilaginibacter sp. NFX135 TaxID=3402687 RepID=UPI003AFA982B
MITELEQETLDIDWFFISGESIAFVASGGGKLPASVAKSLERNQMLASFFRGLPVRSEIIINPDLNSVVTTAIDERYLADFMHMAERGLYSFDKTVLNNFSEPHYHLVARPVTPLKLDQLPAEIREIISESQYSGDIESTIDTNLIL